MEHRFLIHAVSHTWVVVDITQICLLSEIYPEEGKKQIVSAYGFGVGKMSRAISAS